jgi:15-cis-phytoene synthase
MTQPAPGSAEADADYINAWVRSQDRDRYWSALLAPGAIREDLLALFAFHLELAHIPEHVREPQLGEIRLQWWREALAAALAGDPAEHPVLKALAKTARAHTLPPELLDGMIEARHVDLARDPMPDFSALEAYLDATAGALFQLGALIGGHLLPEDGVRNAALAYGLTGLMRALPYHAARGQIFLPADLLARHGVHPRHLLQGDASEDLRAALRELRQKAETALDAARPALADVPKAALAGLLPLALTRPHLRKLAAPAHHPLRDIAQLNPLTRFALIWRASLRGRI